MPFPSLTRSVLGLAAVVLAAGFCVRSAHAGAIISRPLYLGLDQGLVGYWSFEGKTVSGTRAHDTSGQGNHGTMTNGPQTATGKIGQGMQFDGSDDVVNAGNGASLNNIDDLTLSAWMYLKSYGEASAGRILDKQSNGWLWFVSNKGFQWEALRWDTTDGKWEAPAGSIGLGRWHHVAVTYSYSSPSNVPAFYIDGQKVAVTTQQSPAGSAGADSSTLYIGSDATTARTFDGLIDDVRIYNRALNADEIKRLYKIGATAKVGTTISTDSLQKGLVGHWSFDGKTIAGTRAHDVSGQDNHGTMTNGPQTATGKLGQAMEFDGGDDYVDLTSTSGFSEGSGASWTLAAWAKTDVLNSNYHFIVGYGDATSGASPHIQLDNLNHWQTSTYGNDLSGPPAVKGQWTHVVGVGSGTTLRLYIDGQQYASTVVTNAPVTTRARIGTDMSASPALNFDGLIDDVRIYNRALSVDEIKRLYNNGATAKVGVASNTDSLQKGLVGYWTFDGKDMAGVAPATQYALDASGNGNRGTLTNGPQTAAGKLGQGMLFDGVDDYVSIPYNASLAPSQFTISVWVRRRVTCFGSPRAIYHSAGGGGFSSGWGLVCSNDEAALRWGTGAGNDGNIRTTPQRLGWDTWHHIVGSYNGTAMRIYMDGIFYQEDTTVIMGYSGTPNAEIGVSSGVPNFLGDIDDVRIYNRALSLDEIKRLYNMGR